ncbi:tetratricopeptide repeat protein [Oceanobacillus jeddahense]|uniref:Tetratricopeptide repeat protein n=1 Tax=Oceanobacillus jeddahense TaxID=1462527 RepID=A0ABY5JY37_9BACI|nr:tetratricopeptide repeat protein [Oceanobacillus jeddahense]UUI05312.1 tetratricopeptide repeat protein [Oceanobacillus jeddahense]
MKDSTKVILFPNTKKKLEEEGLYALKEKRYKEALDKLNCLIAYHEGSHEIYIGKLMCLMELGNYKEAEQLSEKLLARKDEHYYHYFHIYLTLLFQTSQYQHLMDLLEIEFEHNMIPDMLQEPFQQLYEMSSNMKIGIDEDNAKGFLAELKEAVSGDDYLKQWNLIDNLRRIKADPKEENIKLLENPQVHPVIKTALLKWLKEAGVERSIYIHKFETSIIIQPSELNQISKENSYKTVMEELEKRAEANPTLLNLIKQLVYRYFYVTYPFTPKKSDLFSFAEAVYILGNEYLQIDTQLEDLDRNAESWIESIKICNSLYLSIIEE